MWLPSYIIKDDLYLLSHYFGKQDVDLDIWKYFQDMGEFSVTVSSKRVVHRSLSPMCISHLEHWVYHVEAHPQLPEWLR